MVAPAAAEAPAAAGRGSSPKITGPSGRVAAHADKLRAKANRRAKSPGPGAYNPQPSDAKKKSDKNQGSSFVSKSKRMVEGLGAQESGDPGSYDPYTLKELASTSKKSFAKSNRTGMGDFGGKEKRELNIEIMGEATPGPGAYNGGDMLRSGKKAALSAFDTGEKMPSSSFHSKSAQREKQQNLHVPGAGAYTPNWSACEKNMLNSANGMKSRGPRFSGADTWERAQRTEPGPGAYEIEYLRSGSKSSVSGVVGASVNKEVAFGTDSLRELPWEN